MQQPEQRQITTHELYHPLPVSSPPAINWYLNTIAKTPKNEYSSLKYWKSFKMESVEVLKLLYLKFLIDPDELEREKSFKNREHFEQFFEEAKSAWKIEKGTQLLPPTTAGKFNPASKKIVALSLDGGGIRGLVSSLTLRFVSNCLFGDEEIGRRVHWMTGTSTGAIIALTLISKNYVIDENGKTARRFYTPTDCIHLYWKLKSDVLGKKIAQTRKRDVARSAWNAASAASKKILPSWFRSKESNFRADAAEALLDLLNYFEKEAYARKIDGTDGIQGAVLQDVLKNHFGEEMLCRTREATPGSGSNRRKFIPKVCITSLNIFHTPAELVLHRNYDHPEGPILASPYKMWEVARMSSAAPTFFSPLIYGGNEVHVDGGLTSNAPVDIMLKEIHQDKKAKIGAFLSIGTGSPTKKERDQIVWEPKNTKERIYNLLALKDLLQEQCTGSDGKALQCAQAFLEYENRNTNGDIPKVEFVRLAPENIDVELDETDNKKLIDMMWDTLLYLTKEDTLKAIEKFAENWHTAQRRHRVCTQ